MSTDITFDDKHIYCGTRIVADVRQDLPTVYRRELEGFLLNRRESAISSAIHALIDVIVEYDIEDRRVDEAVGVLSDAGLLS